MRFSQIITENQNIVYHGDDFGTTRLDPRYMMHDGSNNQEGVGIYFSPKLEVAQTYGKHISTISLDGLRIENSRALVADVVRNADAIKFLQYLNQHNDEFWYLLTDYGIEVSDQREVKPIHLAKLHSMMRNEELRNWQIELAQTTNINVFVSGWNQFIRIDALYEQVRQFYAVINTQVPVTLLTRDDLSENEQLDEVSVMSSWIADLSYQDRILYLTLKNGRRYEIFGLSPAMARQWLRAPSKGKFWHSNIRGNYRVSRL